MTERERGTMNELSTLHGESTGHACSSISEVMRRNPRDPRHLQCMHTVRRRSVVAKAIDNGF
jgi:hypothetical protein